MSTIENTNLSLEEIRNLSDEELTKYITDVFTAGYISCLNEKNKVMDAISANSSFKIKDSN